MLVHLQNPHRKKQMNTRSFVLLTLTALAGCMEPPLPVETVDTPGTYEFNYDYEYVLEITSSSISSTITVNGGIVHVQMGGLGNTLTVNNGTQIAECTLEGASNSLYNNTGTPVICMNDGLNFNNVYQ